MGWVLQEVRQEERQISAKFLEALGPKWVDGEFC